MDVRMPDGAIVRGVPDDITQSELLRRYTLYKAPSEATPEETKQLVNRQLGLAGLLQPQQVVPAEPVQQVAPSPTAPVQQVAPQIPAVQMQQVAPPQPKEEQPWFSGIAKFGQDQQKKREQLANAAVPLAQDVGAAIAATPLAFLAGAQALSQGSKAEALTGDDWKNDFISEQRALAKKNAENPELKDQYILGVDRARIRNMPQNLAFSVLSMGAGLAGAAVGFVTPVPFATEAGTLAASGAAAYRMDTNGFLRDIREKLDDASIKATGKPLTDEQWLKTAQEYQGLVREHGAWEALPEALGNVFGNKLAGVIFKEAGQGLMGVLKSFGAGALELANELGTETITQIGQHNAELAAGVNDDPNAKPRSFTNPDDIWKSAKEVAPDVLLLTGAMSGGAHVAGSIYNATDYAKTRELAKELNAKDFLDTKTPEGLLALQNAALKQFQSPLTRGNEISPFQTVATPGINPYQPPEPPEEEQVPETPSAPPTPRAGTLPVDEDTQAMLDELQGKPAKPKAPTADINEKNLKGRYDGIFSGKDFASENEDETWYSPKTNKLYTEAVDGTPVQHYAGDKTATGLTNVTPINTPEEAKAALDAGKSFATVQEGTDPFKPVETKATTKNKPKQISDLSPAEKLDLANKVLSKPANEVDKVALNKLIDDFGVSLEGLGNIRNKNDENSIKAKQHLLRQHIEGMQGKAEKPVQNKDNPIQTFDAGNNTEVRVFPNDKGYIANFYDKDSGNYIGGKIFPTSNFGDQALPKALEFAQVEADKSKKLTGETSEAQQVAPTTQGAPGVQQVAPTDVQANPASTVQPSADVPLDEKAKAKQDLEDALGDLSLLMGKGGRLNIVPEDEQKLMPILTKLMDAAFRMGYIKFKEAAKFVMDMIRSKIGKDVADQVSLDHLQGAYIGMAGKYQDKGADTKKDVISVESLNEIHNEAPATTDVDINTPQGQFHVATQIGAFFLEGGRFENINQARAKIEEITGQKIQPGTNEAKSADEAIEVGVVLAARHIVGQGGKPEQIYDQLVNLYGRQPNLSVRSSESVAHQAYSTPAPLAYIASRLAGINPNTRVYEPTAGNGMLLIGANQDKTYANELQPGRAAILEMVLPNATVTNLNAAKTNIDSSDIGTMDVVIANPPFGVVKDKEGRPITHNALWFDTKEIDHAIVFRSLRTMKDNGRAVLIVGGVMGKTDEARAEDYRSKAKRDFYSELYRRYNVVDHFTVGGNLYTKQGASYPVDVIVIDGVRNGAPLVNDKGEIQTARALPAFDLPKVYETYGQLKEKLNENTLVSGRNERPTGVDSGIRTEGNINEQGLAEGVSGQGVRPSTSGEESDGGGRHGVSENGPATSVQPESTGTSVGKSQPQPSNAPKPSGEGESISGKGEVKPIGGKGTEGNKPGRLGGVSVVSGERIGSGLKNRVGEEAETENQVSYTPRSRANSVGTLVPKAMAQSIEQALARLEQQVGNLDNYVAKNLNMDLGELFSNFSAEQVDAIALAIYNAEAGKGFIIGDQTGIGKGRVVAAMIKYALVNDKIPIFVTEKPNLYSDMIRDLDDIGMTDQIGLDKPHTKILITNNKVNIPYKLVRKVNGEIVEIKLILKAPKSDAELNALFKEMQNKDDIGPYKVIFTTYNQLQTVKGQETERQRLIRHFGAGNYMIFDESHNAGGAGETQARTKEQREKAKEGESLVTGRASYIRKLVQSAYGTFFSSATYAKRADVLDLYASTDMKLAVNNINELANAIKNGGIPMQQTVAKMLTEVGQYIRRERTFVGVSYDTKEAYVDKQTAENIATSMRKVLEFSRAKEKVVKELQKSFDKQGGKVRSTGEKIQVQSANFGSIMHSLINQMLLALKTKSTVDYAIQRLKANEKVVITVSNTMGTFLKDYAEDMDLNLGDEVNLSFKDLYLKYLEKQRVITIKKSKDVEEKYRLTDQDLGPELVKQYNDIKKFIENAGFSEAPISPIDYIHNALRKAGFKTEEITGRTITLNYTDGKPKLSSRIANIKQRVNAVDAFNNGKVDVIILNQAGSTGLSLHASSKFQDQRKRHMIIAQAENNIDTHMQMLGRVHRTGQIIPPAYSQMMADIPAEMRPAAVLLKKMASLNANTTASRKSAVSAEGVVDFINDYGGQVAQEYLRDNPDVHEAIGGNKNLDLTEDPTEGTEDDIRKLTGYIPILPIKQQEEIYKDIIERYNDLLQREESMGTNKLEAKAHDLDAKTLSSKPITEDKGSSSVFAQPAYMEKVDVKRTIKPYSKAEVQEQIDENLDGKTPEEKAKEMFASLTPRASEFGKQRLAELAESGADPTKIEEVKGQMNLQYGKIRSILTTYPIGTPIVLKSKNGTLISGVITNVENKGKTKNPLAGSDWKMQVALANGDDKSISINFSQVNSVYELRKESEVPWHNPETDKYEYIPMMDLFDKSATVRREKRWMVTGNLLAGFAAVNNMGQIMSYTKDDGTTGQGILMPRTFDFEKEEKRAPVKLNTLQKVQVFFDNFQNGIVQTEDGSLKIFKRGERYQFTTSKSKREGGQYYLNQGLTNFTGTFHSSGSQMNAVIYDQEKGKEAIKYILNDMQLGLVAGNYKDEAKALFAPKEEFKPPLSNLSPINNFIDDREQYIKELQAAKLKKAALFKKFAEGKAGLTEQHSANLINTWVHTLQETIAATKPEKKSAKDFFAKATKDWSEGKISDSVYSTIKTLYEKYPFVLEGLSLSINKGKENKSAAGEFEPIQRIINLFKGTHGVTDPVTIRHELTHSLEQMMNKEASMSLVKEWGMQVKAKMKSDQTKEGKAFFKALTDFYADPSLEQYNMLIAALPDPSYYQYVNPSEYWAVNAEKLLAQKLGSGWDRFKLAIRKLYEGLKSLIGLTNQRALYKVFDDIMTEKGTRMTNSALRDYVDASTMALQNKNFRNFKGAPAPKATWDVSEPFKEGDWEHRLVDRNLDTKQIVKDINDQVGQIQDAWDPYLKLTTMPGRKADQVNKFLKEEGRPFIEKMHKLGVTVDEFEKYLHNRHAEEYNNLIASRNAALPDGGSGIDTKDAHDYLNKLPADKKQKYQDLAKDIDNIVRETQDLLVASGTEKAETIQGWRDKMPYYVPLNRDEEELDFAGNTSKGFGKGISTGGAFTKAGTGSTKTVVDILNNIFLQRERAINRAENARVGRALIGLALQAPNTDYWLPINPRAIRNKKKLYQNLIDMGLTPQDADNFIKEPTVASIDKLTGQVQYRVNPVLRGSKNVITVRVNGEDWYVFFNPGNPRAMRMAEALKNMDSSSVAEILSRVAEVTRTMAAMNTQYNPLFGPWNLLRDYTEANITLGATPIAGKNEELRKGILPAMRAIYRMNREKGATSPEMQKWMDLFDQYKAAGGLTGFRQQFSGSNKREAIVDRELKVLDKSNVRKVASAVMDWLSDYNEALENAVRLSAFKVALDEGISEERAAEIGKEITVNFDRKGQWSANAGALFAFFNGSMQGTAKMARVMVTKKNGKMELTKLGMQIVAGGVFLGVMQAFVLKMWGFDEDEPPEYLKNKSLIIPIGGGKYLNPPMPLGYSVFPSIGRIIAEYMLSGGKDPGKHIISILNAIGDAFNPLGGGGFIQSFSPTVIDPLFGIAENRDAFGRPIAKQTNPFKPTPGYERNRESASAFSKGLAYALNYISGGGKYGIGMVSPTADQLDYLIGQYAGGVGREIMKTVDLASIPFKDEPIPSYKIPIVGKVYGETGSDTAIQDKFYKNIIQMGEYQNMIKNMKQDRANLESFYLRHPEAKLYERGNDAENKVNKINMDRKDLIRKNASKDQLKNNHNAKIAIMKKFNEKVEERQ